jgi:hypothetical protein
LLMRGFSGKLNVPGRAAGTDEWQYRLMRESAQSPSAEAPTVFTLLEIPRILEHVRLGSGSATRPVSGRMSYRIPLERRTPAPQNRWV